MWKVSRRQDSLDPVSLIVAFVAAVGGFWGASARGQAIEDSASNQPAFTAEQLEFFESRVRPLLVEHCYACHSGRAESLEAGLRVDARSHLLEGGDSGKAVVPGDANSSLLVAAVRYDGLEMPPDRRLSAAEVSDLERWINEGAAWPAEVLGEEMSETPAEVDWDRARSEHWAWRPLQDSTEPQVERTDWVRDPLDAYILAAMEARGLSPSPEAEARELLRRLHWDLVGLPPTWDEVVRFEATHARDAEAAIAEVVDELLSRPAYAERWARHWLDVARYSDGYGGFLDSAGLDQAWRYRDWVVDALDADLPIDQFYRWQIAGDLLHGHEGAVATGFLALGPTYQSDGGDPESIAQARAETLDDRVDTVSRGMLGVTLACARCHDHKFDPIPQRDYYAFAGIFANTEVRETPLAPAAVVEAWDRHRAELDATRVRRDELRGKPAAEGREATVEENAELAKLEARVRELEQAAPPGYDRGHALVDIGSSDLAVALRGNPRRLGEVAPRRFLTLFPQVAWPEAVEGSGRLALADAVVDVRNPLTARVFVNRIWGHHFGVGLVRTPSNFGKLGEEPSHPELLDRLALEFMHDGWSLKRLHRRILLSSTYRQSSRFDPQKYALDGDNRWLWRQNPRRSDVEAWRDSLLAITGELDDSRGGPSIDDINASRRRTLYAKVSRSGEQFASDRFLRTFDFPLMRSSVEQRPTSIVPQQYLFLLNSSFVEERARAFAASLIQSGENDADRIRIAYQRALGREPSPTELALGLAFVKGDQRPIESEAAETEVVAQSERADQLLADFEGENYGAWVATGEAFGTGPARGTLPSQMTVSGYLGRGLVNSYLGGDGTTGELLSPEFTIERRYLKFLIGGGKYPDETFVALEIDGKIVRKATGPNDQGGGSERLDWHVWDMSEFEGQRARVRIVDRRVAGWGHLNLDHLMASDSPQIQPVDETSGAGEAWGVWEQYAQVLLSSNELLFVR